MIKHVEDTANRYVEELKELHSGLEVEVVEDESPWIDARLKVKCTSHEQLWEVLDTVAQLTTDFYMDHGVYITTSPTFTGPMPQ